MVPVRVGARRYGHHPQIHWVGIPERKKGGRVHRGWCRAVQGSSLLFLRDCVECKKFERGELVEQQSCSRMCRDEIETVQELGKSGDGAHGTNFCPKARKHGAAYTLHARVPSTRALTASQSCRGQGQGRCKLHLQGRERLRGALPVL